MASVNNVVLIGNLGADPVLRYSGDGTRAVARISIATSRRYKAKDGNYAEETEWHSVVLFGRYAETAARYLHKGSCVFIEGRLHTSKYQDRNGQDRWSTEIIAEDMQFVGPRTPAEVPAPKTSAEPHGKEAADAAAGAGADMRDIPF